MTLNFLKLKSLMLGKIIWFLYKKQIQDKTVDAIDVCNEIQDALLHNWTIRHWFDFIYKSRQLLLMKNNKFDATNVSCRNNLAFFGNKHIIVDNINNIKTRHAKFKFCLNVKNLTLEAEHVDEDMFYMNISLKTARLIGTKCIHKHAFRNCISLESIYIPHDVEKIEEYAFENCLNLKHVIFY